MSRPVRSAIIAFVLTAGLSACGMTNAQRPATQTFASATAALGDTTSDELAKMRDAMIEMNIAALGLPDEAAEQGIRNGDAEFLDRGVERELVTGYAAGGRALKAYGTALSELAAASTAEEVKRANANMAGAFNNLPDSVKVLDKKDVDATAGVVASVNNLFTEGMKARAIRTLVPTYGPAVSTLCEMVARPFDPGAVGANGRPMPISAYSTRSSDLQLRSRRLLRSRPGDLEARRAAVIALRLGTGHRTKADTLAAGVKAASESCVKANAELMKAAQSSDTDLNDIIRYAEQVSELVNAVSAF